MYLNQSPCFHYEGILQPVDNEPIDLFPGQHRSLAQILHQGNCVVYYGLFCPGCRDDLHQGDVMRRVDLKWNCDNIIPEVDNHFDYGCYIFVARGRCFWLNYIGLTRDSGCLVEGEISDCFTR